MEIAFISKEKEICLLIHNQPKTLNLKGMKTTLYTKYFILTEEQM